MRTWIDFPHPVDVFLLHAKGKSLVRDTSDKFKLRFVFTGARAPGISEMIGEGKCLSKANAFQGLTIQQRMFHISYFLLGVGVDVRRRVGERAEGVRVRGIGGVRD